MRRMIGILEKKPRMPQSSIWSRRATARRSRQSREEHIWHAVGPRLRCLLRTADIFRPTREFNMKDAHNTAAEHHESAAKSHRAAAAAHGSNDHAKGKEHSTQDQQHATNDEE